MTIEEIKNGLNNSEYGFLSNNEHLGSHIILLGLGGSYAYGTNTETSDIDIRGIALNTKEEVLLRKDFEQVVDKPTDTTIYSFHKMMGLLMECNPNTIEILGLKPEHYLVKTDIADEIIANKKLFLSKVCIAKFTGYMNMQLYRLKQACSISSDLDDLEKHILSRLNSMMKSYKDRYENFNADMFRLYIDKAIHDNMNTEIFMDLNLKHYSLRDFNTIYNELNTTVTQYNKIGKRDKYALEHSRISKHSMHLIRSQLMLIDILMEGEIVTYREKEHDLLLSIRNGEYLDDKGFPNKAFYRLVDEVNKRVERAIEKTKLPDRVDTDKINKLIISVNERIVKEEI